MADVIRLDIEGQDGLFLGEADTSSPSDPRRLTATNHSEHVIRQVSVGMQGPNAQYVQLRRTRDVTWLPPGEPLLLAELMQPGETVSFMSRMLPLGPEVDIGMHQFEYVINSTSIT